VQCPHAPRAVWASFSYAMSNDQRPVHSLKERITALILAGGRSSRMGRDKTWLELAGMPLVETTARRVMPLVDEFVFSTNDPERFEPLVKRLPLPAHVVRDLTPGAGPLEGVAAGLGTASFDLVLVLAVDMPFVQLGLLSHMATLAAGYQAVVPNLPDPATGGYMAEPLHAYYRRGCLPSVSEHLQAGHRRVISFLNDVRTRWVSPEEIAAFDPDFISFRNLNTLEDWDFATRYFALQ
jgi:molybdopterin-guanine dinucleotide biosynthesis protein A